MLEHLSMFFFSKNKQQKYTKICKNNQHLLNKVVIINEIIFVFSLWYQYMVHILTNIQYIIQNNNNNNFYIHFQLIKMPKANFLVSIAAAVYGLYPKKIHS